MPTLLLLQDAVSYNMQLQRMLRGLLEICTINTLYLGYADGERERLGAVEHKLFVGSMNRHVAEKEIEEIFAPYGRVEDVYVMRDDLKQIRGCGFVKFSHRDMEAAAINALNGTYLMRGCDQPLTVRFADPKRPRVGDSRCVVRIIRKLIVLLVCTCH